MQQVNLYTSAFRPTQIVLPFKHIAVGAITLLVLLVLVSIYLSSSQSVQSKALKSLQASAIVKQDEVASQKSYLASLKPDQNLVRVNRELAQKIEQGRTLVSEFERLSLNELKSFSPYFIGLARHTQPGIWLSQITIDDGGKYLRLQGQALNADDVPKYLARLGAEASFKGSRFSLFNVNGDTEGKDTFSFILESAANHGDERSTVAGMAPAASNLKGGR